MFVLLTYLNIGDIMLSCDKEPKVISIDTIIEDSGVDPMRYKNWSELTFDEAVIRGYDEIKSDLTAVTIHLPLWLRTEVSNINLLTNVSQGRLYTAMANYGCSLMKPVVKDPIKDMYDSYLTLGTADNAFIMKIMQDMKINVDGVKGGGRKTISVPMWCKNFIGNVANNLRMEFSSVVRLSLYTAIIRYELIEAHNKHTCQKELTMFEKTFNDHVFVCTAISDKIKQSRRTEQ